MHVCIIICAKIDHLIALTLKVSEKLGCYTTYSWSWLRFNQKDLHCYEFLWYNAAKIVFTFIKNRQYPHFRSLSGQWWLIKNVFIYWIKSWYYPFDLFAYVINRAKWSYYHYYNGNSLLMVHLWCDMV